MSKILAVDLDGTLFYPKGRKQLVSNKNIEFLRKFIDAGNRLVLVSSRNEDTISKVIKEIDRDVDFIGVNGCVMSVNGKIIKDISIPTDTLTELVDNIFKEHKPIALLSTSKNYPIVIGTLGGAGRFLKWFYAKYYSLTFGIYAEKYSVDNDIFFDEIKNGHVYTVRVFTGLSAKKKNKVNKQLNTVFREKYPSVEASWVGALIELTPKGCSKAESLLNYLEMINASKDDLYVVGDSGNDISMFKQFFEHSFVMKHAHSSVKRYAKYEVPRVYKLDKYLFEKEND